MDVNLNINGDNDFISFSKLKKVKSELSNNILFEQLIINFGDIQFFCFQ